jgi:hypothetical protein
MCIRAGYAEAFACPKDVDTSIGHDIVVVRSRQSEIVHPHAGEMITQRRDRKPLLILACNLGERSLRD